MPEVDDEKAEIIDGTENPISNTYKKNSIPFFLADIETYENTWGAMGAEIEINKYEDGLVVDMKLAIILPNGGMYDQHISFICSGDFEEQSKTENESKSINSASSFNLSEEQKNNFAIIKNKSEHHTVSKSTKSSFSFDEETKENEFSQNSMVMNVKQTSDQNDQNNVSIFKSKALISALIIFVLLLIVIGVIFTNSLNSIN